MPQNIVQDDITVINSLNLKRFARLLTRICENFDKETNELFNEEETSKLCEMFDIIPKQLECVLMTSKELLLHIAYNDYSEKTFCSELQKQHPLSDNMVELFSGCWIKYRQPLLTQLKQKPNIFNSFTDISYNVCNEISQSNVYNRELKMANVQFKTYDHNLKKESVTSVNFQRPELYKLYNEIEKIQIVLDKLA